MSFQQSYLNQAIQKPESKLNRLAIRSATVYDVNSIISLQNSTVPVRYLTYSHASLAAKIENDSSYVIVAEFDGKFVGFACLTDNKFGPWTDGNLLAVDQMYFGQRVAAKLLHAKIMRTNRPLLRTFVQSPSMSTKRLYKRFGFHQLRISKTYYSDGEETQLFFSYTGFRKKIKMNDHSSTVCMYSTID